MAKTPDASAVTQKFEHFFKPEIQRSGHDLVKKKSVYLSVGTDTQIDASVRATTPAKVGFRAESIGDESFVADCSCAPSKRGQFCKHIWAVLELASREKPDFFESKSTLEKGEFVSARMTAAVAKSRREGAPKSEATVAAAEAFNAKQSDYRKSVYQSQKLRAKEFKEKRQANERHDSIRTSAFSKTLPDEIRAAIEYFEKNGFPLAIPVDETTINNAKRILSRVFHPDKGGTHEEIVELLRHSDALVKYRL